MTLYTSKVIAQWLCLTERRVRQLRDEGVIVEARPGLYELQPTVARYIKYLGGAGKESLNTERMKLTAEKRKAAEMDNDLRRGDLHSTQDIEKGIQTMCLNIRSRFLAMPAKLSPTLAAMDGNQAAIFDEMKKAIDETLEELSDYSRIQGAGRQHRGHRPHSRTACRRILTRPFLRKTNTQTATPLTVKMC